MNEGHQIPSPSSNEKLLSNQRRLLYWGLYAEFNASLSQALEIFYDMKPECVGSLTSFFDSSSSVLLSDSISESDCKGTCFPALNRSLSLVAAQSGGLWQRFLSAAPSAR